MDHEDIWLKSNIKINFKQFFDDTLNYDNLTINQEKYNDYRPTKLQFHISSLEMESSIQGKIYYANRLTRTHARNAKVCQYNSNTKEWVPVKTIQNNKEKTLEFEVNQAGVIGVFVNHYWYTSFTQRMADEYPNWTKIRNNKESVGQQFLNYFGLELETIQDYLEWIQEQKYIGTADLHMHDWIYMYQLPDIKTSDKLEVFKGTSEEVPVLDTIQTFFYNDTNQGGIFDYQENRFYTTKSYGNLRLLLTRKESITAHEITPMNFHLWNTFDEFGLLVGVTRQHLEDNASFKERILDVFRYPSGTHDIGLTNGIARDLNMIQRFIWKDDTKNCLLQNKEGKTIDVRSIRINNQPLEEDDYIVDGAGNILIYKKNMGTSHEVSYITGIEKYQIYDRNNTSLYKMMYQEDGQATSMLRSWVEYINTFAPVMWNHFNWDEGFWDTIDKDLTGLGYLPNIWDSNIDVWKDYALESER